MPSEDTETVVKKNGAIPEIREEVIYCILFNIKLIGRAASVSSSYILKFSFKEAFI